MSVLKSTKDQPIKGFKVIHLNNDEKFFLKEFKRMMRNCCELYCRWSIHHHQHCVNLKRSLKKILFTIMRAQGIRFLIYWFFYFYVSILSIKDPAGNLLYYIFRGFRSRKNLTHIVKWVKDNSVLWNCQKFLEIRNVDLKSQIFNLNFW